MVKPRGVGLPYLKSTLRYEFNSCRVLTSKESFEEFQMKLAEHLKPASELVGKTTSGPRGHECKSSEFVIGMQPVFDAMSDGSARTVLFDLQSIAPSAVATAIGIYVTNCTDTVSYGIRDLTKCLANIGIIADAIGTTVSAVPFNAFIEGCSLQLIAAAQPSQQKSGASKLLAPVELARSVGKQHKKKHK